MAQTAAESKTLQAIDNRQGADKGERSRPRQQSAVSTLQPPAVRPTDGGGWEQMTDTTSNNKQRVRCKTDPKTLSLSLSLSLSLLFSPLSSLRQNYLSL